MFGLCFFLPHCENVELEEVQTAIITYKMPSP